MRVKISVILLVLVIFVAACQGSAASKVTPTPTVDPGVQLTQTAAFQATQDQLATEQASQTVVAQQTADAQATLDAQATAQAQSTANAIATSTQRVLNSQATSTQVVVKRQTATAQANQQATAQAQPLYDLAEKLFAEGVISSSAGSYTPLKDFDNSWAQMNYYDYWPTDLYIEPFSRFILKADFRWDSGSDKANWDRSGCGFVFGWQENLHYLVYLALDGKVNLLRSRQGNLTWVAQQSYSGKLSIPRGQAQFVLAVDNAAINIYVNDELTAHANDILLKPGAIFTSMVSGTNKGFGTRCTMTNMGIWLLK
ncbi:MAG: hypothetical protein AB1894_11785 [Chloroflexota bacterium]